MGKLEGRVIIVTGTSRGIGKAMAEGFAREGATVIGASRSEGCDVTREEDVVRLFSEAVDRNGGVDVVVNNAGILTPRKPLVEVTKEEWDRSLDANLTGVFLCTREALRRMIPRGRGLIINLSSGVADRAAPTWGPYAVAKWGALGLTKLIAEEARDQGVKVVAVNPSGTRTPMRASAYPDEDPMSLKTPEETARFFVALAAGDVPFQSGDLLEYTPES